MSDYVNNTRRMLLDNIKIGLSDLCMNPPRLSADSSVDVGKLRQQVEEVKVFWVAYRQIAQIEKDPWAMKNLAHDERELYRRCAYQLSLLEAWLGEVKV
jgi:hypothetical protein